MEPLEVRGLGDLAARLGAALIVGSVLGINRELSHKPAGMRTHVLVSLGAATLTLAGVKLANDGIQIDRRAAATVIQGIIAGIGFLGAGVILRDRSGHIQGLTTAAAIWVAACLGVTCALGLWWETGLALALTMFALVAGGPLERKLNTLLGNPDIPSSDSQGDDDVNSESEVQSDPENSTRQK